jgi:hypothetical protein
MKILKASVIYFLIAFGARFVFGPCVYFGPSHDSGRESISEYLANRDPVSGILADFYVILTFNP